jgi:hypothetical protein
VPFLFNYNNGIPRDDFAWRSTRPMRNYIFQFCSWPFLEISSTPLTKIRLNELQLYDIMHTLPFVAVGIYHTVFNVGRHCVKNIEMIMLFLQAFTDKLFPIKFSEEDLLNMTECFLYPLFSSLDDSLQDFFNMLSTLCLVPLEINEINQTIQYLKNINYETKIQNLFKYILCTRFLTHKYFNTTTLTWNTNVFYELACKKSFLIMIDSKHIL